MKTLEQIKSDIEKYKEAYTDEGLKSPQAVYLERLIESLLDIIDDMELQQIADSERLDDPR